VWFPRRGSGELACLKVNPHRGPNRSEPGAGVSSKESPPGRTAPCRRPTRTYVGPTASPWLESTSTRGVTPVEGTVRHGDRGPDRCARRDRPSQAARRSEKSRQTTQLAPRGVMHLRDIVTLSHGLSGRMGQNPCWPRRCFMVPLTTIGVRWISSRLSWRLASGRAEPPQDDKSDNRGRGRADPSRAW
jgi:hypothetical protein